MWTDDHEPPRPTSTWKPGETIQYHADRVRADLSLRRQGHGSDGPVQPERRTAAAARGAPMRASAAYTVGTLELLPQSENVFLCSRTAGTRRKSAADNAAVEWQWTKKAATLAFRNPKRDVWFYLNVDGARPVVPSRSRSPCASATRPSTSSRWDSPEPIIRKSARLCGAARGGRHGRSDIEAGTSFVPAQTTGGQQRRSARARRPRVPRVRRTQVDWTIDGRRRRSPRSSV